MVGFEVFKGGDGQWYWRLVGANGQVLAVSEGYTRRWSAWRGARAARKTLRG